MTSILKKIFADRAPKIIESEVFAATPGRRAALYCPKLKVDILMRYGVNAEGHVQLIAKRTGKNRYTIFVKDDEGLHPTKPEKAIHDKDTRMTDIGYMQAVEILEKFDKIGRRISTLNVYPLKTAQQLNNHYSKQDYQPSKLRN